ncbi:unnamed protein product [Ceratitis capitata]|uniref:(Mediterranean fruit fly) hypothetical protein n=1 Tax=Ceratitis capitata TaxID=7213 RepID=A0A811VDE5_CERCA|nr:unnamed protein product [Ceratitis capitata]
MQPKKFSNLQLCIDLAYLRQIWCSFFAGTVKGNFIELGNEKDSYVFLVSVDGLGSLDSRQPADNGEVISVDAMLIPT